MMNITQCHLNSNFSHAGVRHQTLPSTDEPVEHKRLEENVSSESEREHGVIEINLSTYLSLEDSDVEDLPVEEA